MKHLFTTAALLFSMTAFAQVGINNTSPKATLDITAKTTGTKPEGLIMPQLSGNNIHTATAATVYGTNQKGLIVYASSADTNPTGATANITAAGYYYFDGTNWQKVMTGSVANADLATGVGGIYKGSGSLSGNTTVTQGANTLAFTSTTTNGFSVDGTTLSVDAANHRVGIGTTTPATKLHTVSSSAYGAFQMQDGSEATGKFLSSNATGQATWVNSPLTPVVFGTLNSNYITLTDNKYINSNITLTKGKWLIYIGILVTSPGTPSNTNNKWIRLTLGSNNSGASATQSGFTFLSSYLVSGWLSQIPSPYSYTFLSGVIPVDVTNASQTLYLWTHSLQLVGTDPGATTSFFNENYLFAVPAY